MNETEILGKLGLTLEWVDEFVQESNQLDTDLVPPDALSLVYDGHRDALMYALQMSAEDRFALPHEVHRLLLRDHPQAGVLRKSAAGKSTKAPAQKHLAWLLWSWNRTVYHTIDAMRSDDPTLIEHDDKVSSVWDLHCRFMNIHPYELYSGKVGRILMINHAYLVDIEPWIIPSVEGPQDYQDLIEGHESANIYQEPATV